MVMINGDEYPYVTIDSFLQDANKVADQPRVRDVLKFIRGKKMSVEDLKNYVDLSYPQLWQLARLLIKLKLLEEEKIKGVKGNAKVVFTKDKLIKTFTQNREIAIKEQNKVFIESAKSSLGDSKHWEHDPTK